MQILYTKALSLVDSKFTEQQKRRRIFGICGSDWKCGFRSDIILKGAFSDWLKIADASRVRVLWNHDWDRPIGKTWL